MKSQKLNIAITANLVVKILSFLINLLLIKFLYKSLGEVKYGLWVSISMMITYFTIFDFGIGNGLRNSLTKSFSLKQYKKIRHEISTGYIAIVSISSLIVMGLLIINKYSNWTGFFKIPPEFKLEILNSVSVLIVFFGMILVVKMVGVIYSAFQMPQIDNVIKLLGQIIFLFALITITLLNNSINLVTVSLISLLPTAVLYIALSIYLFKYKFKWLQPKISLFTKETLKEISLPSFDFLIINIGVIILLYSDNLIILSQANGESVSAYNILYKLYSLPYVFFHLYVSTHWNAFIDAFALKKTQWIKKKIESFKMLMLGIFFSYLLIYFAENILLSIWIDNSYKNTDFHLSISFIIYFLISTINTAYIYFINSTGKLKLQKIIYIIISIVNIPLSIILMQYYGISGVIIASSICLFPLMLFMYIQHKKIINNTTGGIWLK